MNGVASSVRGGWSDPFVFKLEGRTFVTFKSCGGLVCEATNRELTEWKYVGRMAGVEGECPNFFRLGGKWVLLRSTYPPSYRIGRFDPEKISFIEEKGKGGTLDYVYGPKRISGMHRGFYGTNVMFDDGGRCVLLGWVSGFKGRRGWNGCMSVPRALSLDGDDNLIQIPVRELAKLRGRHVGMTDVTLDSESKTIEGAEGDTIEVVAEFEPGTAAAFGLKLRSSHDGKSALVIRQSAESLNVAGTDVPVRLSAGKTLKLRVLLDKSVMEVFVNDGRHAVTRVVYPGEKDLAVAAFAESGDAAVTRVDVWQMKGIWRDGERWPGLLPTRDSR
jgi:beta-fructofuranosidase